MSKSIMFRFVVFSALWFLFWDLSTKYYYVHIHAIRSTYWAFYGFFGYFFIWPLFIWLDNFSRKKPWFEKAIWLYMFTTVLTGILLYYPFLLFFRWLSSWFSELIVITLLGLNIGCSGFVLGLKFHKTLKRRLAFFTLVISSFIIGVSVLWSVSLLFVSNTRKEDIALRTAILNGDQKITEKMLKNGSDPNTLAEAKPFVAHFIEHDLLDYDSKTVLFLAVETGNLSVVKLLLEYGSNPNAKDRWEDTPIAISATKDQMEIAKELLKNGAEINNLDWRKNSILHDAAFTGSNNCLQLFLELDDSLINMVNQHGNTPLMDAIEGGNIVGKELLIKHGAK